MADGATPAKRIPELLGNLFGRIRRWVFLLKASYARWNGLFIAGNVLISAGTLAERQVNRCYKRAAPDKRFKVSGKCVD